MITPTLAGDELLLDIQSCADDQNQFHVWWLGQSGFLIQWQGRHLLFDPYLSDSLTRKYAETDKPHVRMTELVIDPSRLDFIDVVTSSHNHTDHLDAETLVPIKQASGHVEIVVPAANQTFAAERLQVPPERLVPIDAGETIELGGFRLHAVPAAHEQVERDELGRCKFVGFVAQFGPYAVYHSGDTMLFDGMSETLRQWSVDLALLPINGRAPERRVAGNLNGPEAARLAHEIGAGQVVPCHYDMFEFNTASPDEFQHVCKELDQPCAVLGGGQRLSISK